MSVEIHGTVSEGWEPIHEKFVSNFHSLGELGASLCITFEGETVVDLWAGESDTLGNPWNEDTIAVVNSCTKGAVALACHLLADRGLLDLDAPVSEVWPEFAHGTKAAITNRMMLNPTPGVAAFRRSHDGCLLGLADPVRRVGDGRRRAGQGLQRRSLC